MPSFLPISEAVPGPESPVLSDGMSLPSHPSHNRRLAQLYSHKVPMVSFLPPPLPFISFPSFFLFCKIILVPSDPWHSFSQSPPERGDRRGHLRDYPEARRHLPPPTSHLKLLCFIARSFSSLCSSAFTFILLAYWHFRKPLLIGICSQ